MSTAMQIETFECAEVSSEPVDATAEALELIQSLGLEGQQTLVCPAKAEGQSTRFPFREMLADEKFVYETLCPKKSPIEKYQASPIPLRVLQIAGMAKALMPDCKLVVWDRAEAAIPDPVLVCENSVSEYDRTFKRWILARWGAELEAFPVLMTRCVTETRKLLLDQCESMKSLISSATPAKLAETHTLRDWVWKV